MEQAEPTTVMLEGVGGAGEGVHTAGDATDGPASQQRVGGGPTDAGTAHLGGGDDAVALREQCGESGREPGGRGHVDPLGASTR